MLTKWQVAHRNRRRALLHEIKNVPCADCGGHFHPYCMDFDHLRDKKFTIGYAVVSSRRWSEILEEIEKCEIVCANCHRLRTFMRGK
jgi:hypothetical protein